MRMRDIYRRPPEYREAWSVEEFIERYEQDGRPGIVVVVDEGRALPDTSPYDRLAGSTHIACAGRGREKAASALISRLRRWRQDASA